jgi:hypothetical protein
MYLTLFTTLNVTARVEVSLGHMAIVVRIFMHDRHPGRYFEPTWFPKPDGAMPTPHMSSDDWRVFYSILSPVGVADGSADLKELSATTLTHLEVASQHEHLALRDN